MYLLSRNNRQRRDIEHKITRAITNHAKAEGARTLMVGDLRDIGDGKRLRTKEQQKISGWSHGRQIVFLTYKLAAEGIAIERQSEAYSSKTCPQCGRHNKPNGRNYRCSMCGFIGHRDAVGAVNLESKALYGGFGHMQGDGGGYGVVGPIADALHQEAAAAADKKKIRTEHGGIKARNKKALAIDKNAIRKNQVDSENRAQTAVMHGAVTATDDIPSQQNQEPTNATIRPDLYE